MSRMWRVPFGSPTLHRMPTPREAAAAAVQCKGCRRIYSSLVHMDCPHCGESRATKLTGVGIVPQVKKTGKTILIGGKRWY